MATLRIDVWSDIACPWCYVGKRRLETALTRFAHRDQVEVVWRSFELDPLAPRAVASGIAYAQRLANKYRTGLAKAEGMIDRMTEVGKAEGLELRFDRIHPGSTFDAHRLLHLAHELGRQGQLKEGLFRAYMTEGEALGDPGVLVRVAREAGLDVAEVNVVLASDKYTDEVRADEAEARDLGISGVPFFALANRIGVAGAHPPEVLEQAILTAWETVATASAPPILDASACGPDGCD